MRRAGRIDANQNEIVELLRFVGASVAITSGAGNGLPDLIVGFYGETFLLEVKDGSKVPSARKLTADEQFFVDHWTGRPVAIVEHEIQALRAIGLGETEARMAFIEFLKPKKARKEDAPSTVE